MSSYSQFHFFVPSAELLLVFACRTLSFFHCQKPDYFALHRFALYSLNRVFVEGRVLRGIPSACLEATDRWKALNLTEQTQVRAEDWARVLWVPSRCHWRIRTIRFSDIAAETRYLTLPAALFLIFCKGAAKAKKQRTKAIHWLVQDVVAESQLCISSGSHQDTSQFLSIYNPSPQLSFIASVIHSHWFMNTQAIRSVLPNYSRGLLIDFCSLSMSELEKECSFCISCDKAGWPPARIRSEPKESSGHRFCLEVRVYDTVLHNKTIAICYMTALMSFFFLIPLSLN